MVRLRIWGRNLESKKEIRQRIRRKREQAEYIRLIQDTQKITASVVSHPWFVRTKDLYIYVDCKGEAGTGGIIANCRGGVSKRNECVGSPSNGEYHAFLPYPGNG